MYIIQQTGSPLDKARDHGVLALHGVLTCLAGGEGWGGGLIRTVRHGLYRLYPGPDRLPRSGAVQLRASGSSRCCYCCYTAATAATTTYTVWTVITEFPSFLSSHYSMNHPVSLNIQDIVAPHLRQTL
jgi:hypothetical protein